MMTTNKLVLKKIVVIFIISFTFCSSFFCQDLKWVIAAKAFDFSRGQKQSHVNDALAASLPSDILEHLRKELYRNVMPDEKLERKRAELRKERQSLSLQISSEYKKRDSLVLQNYSEYELKLKIKEQEKKINEIKEKFNANLEKLKQEEEKSKRDMLLIESAKYNSEKNKQKNGIEQFSALIKNIFVKNESLITAEEIKYYRDDVQSLFSPSENLKDSDYLSFQYEKEVTAAGINLLIAGTITEYGDYISVTADLYLYPGAKKIGSATEVGSIQDSDFITSSIARRIVPVLTNSMPVEVEFNIQPERKNTKLYIDDVLQNFETNKFVIDSGFHNIQFQADGYKTAGTNYYFDGNKKYRVEVKMIVLEEGFIQIGLKNSIVGNIYLNGIEADKIDEKKSQIKINGNEILGEFISEDGFTDFFYIPKKLYFDKSYVTIKPKPKDRTKYIDTRRRWMYGAYSLFIVSLIPMFYSYGNYQNYLAKYNAKRANNEYLSKQEYEEALKWQSAANVTGLISIGCGVLWGIELVRYFIAVDSILPQEAKQGDLLQYEFYDQALKSENSDGNGDGEVGEKK